MNVLSLFDGEYAVTDDGRVYSYKRNNPIELVGSVKRTGYRQILLTVNNKRHYCLVHRLVAKAYIPNPENKPEVNHMDGNKLNNNVENLEWVNTRENQLHARDNSLTKSKINMSIANKIRYMYTTKKYSHRLLGEMFGIKKTQIGYIIKNKRWV